MVIVEIKADVLRREAAKRNMSLADLAQILGVGRAHLSVILRGKHRISPKVRRRMLKRLGVSFEELFSVVESQ